MEDGNNHPCFANDLLKMADQFFYVYKNAEKTPPFCWPRYFLLCHSIELSLKAFLAWRGYAEGKLMKFGHKIDKLILEAIDSGLPIDQDVAKNLELLNDPHASYRNRYPLYTIKPAPVDEYFEEDANHLLTCVRKEMRGRNCMII